MKFIHWHGDTNTEYISIPGACWFLYREKGGNYEFVRTTSWRCENQQWWRLHEYGYNPSFITFEEVLKDVPNFFELIL